MMPTENGADVGLEAFGAKVNVRNVKSLNTVATMATLLLVSVLAYMVFAHAGDQKDMGAAIVQAIKEANSEDAKKVAESNNNLAEAMREFATNSKEQTRAAREQNCLLIFEQGERQRQADNCKRLSR